MTNRILCATDGTGHSEQAVALAAELASKLGAELVICVVNVVQGGIRGPLVHAMEDRDVKRTLENAAAAARKGGAKKVSEVALKSRDPGAAVVSYAEENGVDHIVTGTGDKHGISRLVLGSVAADVAARAHCSVTIAR